MFPTSRQPTYLGSYLTCAALALAVTACPALPGMAQSPPPAAAPDHTTDRELDRSPPASSSPTPKTDADDDVQTQLDSSDRAPASPLPGPKYNLHRWLDDFSYLDSPAGSYKPDLFDPIKNIYFDEEWKLSLGGSLRGRFESRTNKFLNPVDPTQDTAFLHRYFVHADLKYRRLFRLYVEGILALSEDNDGPRLAIDENHWDLYQYFADFRLLGEDVPLTFRAGRQELLYGKQRFISPLDWANTRRVFDGFKLWWKDGDWRADAFWVYPVSADRSRFDKFDQRRPLLGLYVTYTGIPDHGIDAYYFYHRNATESSNADGSVGSLNLNMFGTRFWGKSGPFDYDAECAGQFGEFAGDSVQAWAFAAEAGYTFLDTSWTPRIGLGFDYASGDADPNDGRHQTFDQLFPLGHAYLGLIDLVARENILAGDVNLTVRPLDNVTARVAYHAFWLAEEADGLFNAGGALLRRDPTGASSRDIGQEIDLTIVWKLDAHAQMLFGYSHLWNGGFINNTGLGDDADFIYVQYELKF